MQFTSFAVQTYLSLAYKFITLSRVSAGFIPIFSISYSLYPCQFGSSYCLFIWSLTFEISKNIISNSPNGQNASVNSSSSWMFEVSITIILCEYIMFWKSIPSVWSHTLIKFCKISPYIYKYYHIMPCFHPNIHHHIWLVSSVSTSTSISICRYVEQIHWRLSGMHMYGVYQKVTNENMMWTLVILPLYYSPFCYISESLPTELSVQVTTCIFFHIIPITLHLKAFFKIVWQLTAIVNVPWLQSQFYKWSLTHIS